MLLRKEPKAEDLISIRKLLEETEMFYAHEVDVAIELVQDRLDREQHSEYSFIIAEQDSQVLGYTCYGEIPCTEGSYDLFWVAVSMHSQGKGIGGKLLVETEKVISSLEGRKVYIETSNREVYLPTRGFYLKHGYEQEAILKDFYKVGDDKVVYVKTLA